ncbi:hypothetical protein P872_00175 [Rhodonellum psychrophilum GCM71 = DSM 17998]|uniref:HD/PDEase domain-containing protein n=1 Tax=Rhodonellum psychrophilum GCM71 = DSM 17998 TaxID=1123057 RepID=U5C3N0_9BACT|nr:HD domain-containing protein [Rhodonellum psychrophilum]ERM83526.1 hypothetical protein P872_00175 [Rhodonellum psychrophilum GCM71 = DSM 17998]
MKGYFELKKFVFGLLAKELPRHITYHGLEHTLDVLEVCDQYINAFNLSGEEAHLIRIAAIVHDLGFLKSPLNHEEVGAEMASEIMKNLGMDPNHIEEVYRMVMATKIPQTPETDLQKIICDADLDYLGRDDYPEISAKLFEELKALNFLKNKEEWRMLQIKFLQEHSFHTHFAKKHREPKKQFWLNQIKKGKEV